MRWHTERVCRRGNTPRSTPSAHISTSRPPPSSRALRRCSRRTRWRSSTCSAARWAARRRCARRSSCAARAVHSAPALRASRSSSSFSLQARRRALPRAASARADAAHALRCRGRHAPRLCGLPAFIERDAPAHARPRRMARRTRRRPQQQRQRWFPARDLGGRRRLHPLLALLLRRRRDARTWRHRPPRRHFLRCARRNRRHRMRAPRHRGGLVLLRKVRSMPSRRRHRGRRRERSHATAPFGGAGWL